MRFTRVVRQSLLPNLIRQIEFGGPMTIGNLLFKFIPFYTQNLYSRIIEASFVYADSIGASVERILRDT